MQITVKGKWFLAAVFAVYMSAYGLTHNLLFLFGSFLMGLVVYDILAGMVNLSRLTLEIVGSDDLYANRPGFLRIRIKNAKRIVRSAYIGVTLSGGDQLHVEAMADAIPARSAREIEVPIRVDKRGRKTLSDICLFSTHPFGFSRRTRRVDGEVDLIVYPELLDVAPDVFADQIVGGGAIPQRTGDYQYLDTYRLGEDVRLIHWRKSALQEQPVVKRDLVRHRPVRARLFVPDACHHFEYAVSWMATLVVTSGAGIPWAIWSDEGVVEFPLMYDMLEALALVVPVTRDADEPLLHRHDLIPVRASSLTPQSSKVV